MTSKSDACTCPRAWRSLLSQRSSGAPLRYRFEPLSAMIMPYFFSAFRITWFAVEYPETSKLAFRRMPTGAAFESLELAAPCEAGRINAALRVCTGPSVGALFVGKKIPDRPGARVPGISGNVSARKLVEETIRIVENENVAVAGAGIRIALDGGGNRNRHRPRIAFASIGCEIDGDGRLLPADNAVGNADRRAQILARPEVRVHASASPDEIDDRSGIRIHWCGRNIGVPKTVGGKWYEASKTGALVERQGAAAGSLRWRWRLIDGGRRTAACRGDCQEHDAEIEHFAHVCRYTGSNAIPQFAYRTAPSRDTGPKGRSAEVGRCLGSRRQGPILQAWSHWKGESETSHSVGRPSLVLRFSRAVQFAGTSSYRTGS